MKWSDGKGRTLTVEKREVWKILRLKSKIFMNNRIGINVSFLRKPATGIGQVAFNFLKTLNRHPQNFKYLLYAEKNIDLELEKNFIKRVFLPPYKRDDLIRKIWWEKFCLPKKAKQDDCKAFISLYQCSTILPKNIKHTMIVHDIIPKLFPEYLNNWRKKLYWKLTERAIKKADKIIAISEHTKNDLIRYLQIPAEKIEVRYLDVDDIYKKDIDEDECARVLEKYNLEKGYIYFGGGLEKRKNVETLLKAYKSLNEKLRTEVVPRGGVEWNEMTEEVQPREVISNVVLVHGCGDNENDLLYAKKHWQPWIKSELNKNNIEVYFPSMPNSLAPVYKEYKREFDKLDINENSILVGHSCGANFLVRWLSENKQKIKKLILVAPWNEPENKDKIKADFYNIDDVDYSFKENINKIIIFTSDNEEEIGKRTAKMWAEKLSAKLIELKNHGHFTEGYMGTNEFPELLKETLNSNNSFIAQNSKLEVPALVISGKLMPELAPLVTDVEKMVKELGLKERVKLLDFVSQEDLPALYKNANIFVYPSLYEGFGLPVLEAMNCGTPVICSNVSSLLEVGGTAVEYFNPKDEKELAEKMKKLLQDENLRQSLSEKGKEQTKKFSWEKFVR